MMREQVYIVLNEREPLKLAAAQQLEERLRRMNITASRIKSGAEVQEVVAAAHPPIVVVDYLLGDYSTGIDVLERLNKLPNGERPETIFLTDEPSIEVAVTAMRLGARNYVELSAADSIEVICNEIEQILVTPMPHSAKSTPQASIQVDGLVAEAPAASRMIQSIHMAAQAKDPITVVVGEAGSGVSTAALALQGLRSNSALCRHISLKFYDNDFQELLGSCWSGQWREKLGENLSLIIDDVEDDETELLCLIKDSYSKIWPAQKQSEQSFLTIATHSLQTSKAWQNLLGSEVIEVPPLAVRREDIPALTRRFIQEIEQNPRVKVKGLDSKFFAWLQDLEWPGNIKQLRAAIFNTAMYRSATKQELQQVVEESRELWHHQHQEQPLSDLDPLTAALVFEQSGHNLRSAAAKLGLSVTKLRAVLRKAQEE